MDLAGSVVAYGGSANEKREQGQVSPATEREGRTVSLAGVNMSLSRNDATSPKHDKRAREKKGRGGEDGRRTHEREEKGEATRAQWAGMLDTPRRG